MDLVFKRPDPYRYFKSNIIRVVVIPERISTRAYPFRDIWSYDVGFKITVVIT